MDENSTRHAREQILQLLSAESTDITDIDRQLHGYGHVRQVSQQDMRELKESIFLFSLPGLTVRTRDRL